MTLSSGAKAPNEYELAARQAKAEKLAGALLADDEALRRRPLHSVTAAEWQEIALTAGCNPPSRSTVQLVIEIVNARRSYSAA